MTTDRRALRARRRPRRPSRPPAVDPTDSDTAQPVTGDVVGASLRSVRYSEGTALQFIQRAAQLRDDPDGLPYADPIFWAAFTVTGC